MDVKSPSTLAEWVEKKGPHLNLKILWFFISPYKILFFVLIILSILMGLSETVNIAILYPIASSALNLPSESQGNILFRLIDLLPAILPVKDRVIALALLFILIALTTFILNIAYVLLSNRIISQITLDNKIKLFDKYVSADYQYFVDNKQGDLIYQVSRAPAFIAESFLTVTRLIVDAVLSISVFILLLSLSFGGTIVVIIIGASYYLLSRYLSKKVSYMTGTGRYQAGQKELSVLNEYITGVKMIKASESASYWKKEFENSVSTFWRLWKKDNFWIQSTPQAFAVILYAFMALIIVFVRVRFGSDFMPVIPSVVTFAFASFRLLPKIAGFGNSVMHVMGVLPNLEIVSQVLTDSSYNRVKNGSKIFHKLDRNIEFDRVRFSHKNRESTLTDVSLRVDKDKITAIVGPSGSGKSTIVDLVLRLYDTDEGTLRIDDTDITQYDIHSLRRKTGFVSQEPFIYNASVKENITFGIDYNIEEVIEAAKLANAHDFISELPQSYDTLVGDRGVKLSGGEKQRIAIARAMIRKPEILILDEATSFLDYISEHSVQKAIDKVSENTTTLIIAHRLSTIQNADIIYVLDEGRIIEKGRHEELLIQKGKYWELYNTRSREAVSSKKEPGASMDFHD